MAKKLTNEDFIEKAIKIHGNKYDYSLVEYVNAKSKVKILCPEHGVFEQTSAKHLHNKRGCQKCGGSVKLTNRDFIMKARKIHGDKYDYSLVNYITQNIKVKIICPDHGVFEQLPNNHISKKYGCSSCSSNKKLTNIDFIKKSRKIHGDKYDYSLVVYENAHKKVKIICPDHGVFIQEANSHLRNIGCPKCFRSKGEEELEKLLIKNKIIFETQYKYKKCKDKRSLPFDFYLPVYNLCIEYDGKQHFQLINDFWGGETALLKTQKHDKIKNDFCEENNINLLRIKYNENINDRLGSIIEIKKETYEKF